MVTPMERPSDFQWWGVSRGSPLAMLFSSYYYVYRPDPLGVWDPVDYWGFLHDRLEGVVS